jgi:hypothetical protein
MMYKKMGVKVGKGNTGRGARNLNSGSGIAANLEKYRMGNVLPPRGVSLLPSHMVLSRREEVKRLYLRD